MEHKWKIRNPDTKCQYWECEHCHQKVDEDHAKDPNKYAKNCMGCDSDIKRNLLTEM